MRKIKFLLAISIILFCAGSVWGKCIINGQIRDQRGRPARDLKVMAFDSDANRDDYMGRAYTSRSGKFVLRYKNKNWDRGYLGRKSYPDIYIIVYKRLQNKWHKIYQSRIYKDHNKKRNLWISVKTYVPRWIHKAFIRRRGAAGYNTYVNNVVASFKRLNKKGTLLKFHMNKSPDVSVIKNHWQGIQRLYGRFSNWFIVSRSNNKFKDKKHGFTRRPDLVMVKLASKRRNRGGALGSNCRNKNRQAPSRSDKVVFWKNFFPKYKHAGGIQVIGKYGVIGMEEHIQGKNRKAMVAFFDLSNPYRPRYLYRKYMPNRFCIASGIIKMRDGRYLMINMAKINYKQLAIYISNGKSLARNPGFRLVQKLNFKSHGKFQNMQLLTDRRGQIYMIAAHNTSIGAPIINGKDMLHLYKVNVLNPGYRVSLQLVAKKHFFCKSGHGNFNAGVGPYITPNHKLLMYAVEYANGGKSREKLKSVRLSEFR